MDGTPEITDIALSLTGRDKGRIFLVIGISEGRALLVDGKLRKLEHPKSKAMKHLKFLPDGNLRTAQNIRDGTIVSNREIRRALAIYKNEQGASRANDRGGENAWQKMMLSSSRAQ